MCGITGFVDFSCLSSQQYLEQMTQTLLHRGPNDQGSEFYKNDNAVIGLGHTRLSIIDVSPSGHQPMVFKYLTIVLNGEIYNFSEIRKELEIIGHSFESNSDTEVVLHSFSEWGMPCVQKFIGMFAFVIYDHAVRKIYVCRDRLGVKPLFYYWSKGLFLFASELKALHQHPVFEAEKKINSESLALYFQYGYVPGPGSIFQKTFKLEPGAWLTLDLSTKQINIEQYWEVKKFYQRITNPIPYEEAKEQLERLLLSACKYRMVSDVPIGIFLSGGIDSTLVTSLLQRNSKNKLRTYTIGFPDGVNEAPFASAIAASLGTDHSSYDCTEADAKAIVPELPYFYDEPFADISAIPTILVSRLARRDVTVAISADGGDELFAGYDGFSEYAKRLEFLRSIPCPSLSGRFINSIGYFIPSTNHSLKKKFQGVGELLGKTQVAQASTLVEHSLGLSKSQFRDILHGIGSFKHPMLRIGSEDFAEERNYFLFSSIKASLTDQLLVKMDRATMSTGLEGREPLLDHRLIEFSGNLPYEYKHDGVISKKIIRDILYQYIPAELMNRPKTGFDLPIYKWLKEDLSFLVKDHLSTTSVNQTGLFNTVEVSKAVSKFNAGNSSYYEIIWRLLQFQMWHKKWME